MAHLHTVGDSDKHFSIDPVTRIVTNQSGKFVLMQHDHNSERFTFDIPHMVDGHDMSKCNVVQVHYLNVEYEKVDPETLPEGTETIIVDGVTYAATGISYSGIYECDDVKVDETNPDFVSCSWLISRNATQYVGQLSFSVLFSCVDIDGNVDYAWSTEPHTGIAISDGIFNSDVVVAEYQDMLEKWRADTLKLAQEQIDTIVQGKAYEKKKLQFLNTTVQASSFVSDSTYADFPYRAAVALANVQEGMIPYVTLGVNDATSGDFAPVAACYNGGVYLYATSVPQENVTIPTIICWRENT